MAETFEQKTERNIRAHKRYDELMLEGRHGHYETMARVIREEVERERERCASIAEHLSGWGAPPCPDLADEIEQLHMALAEIASIANIPPSDERFGSLAVRMEKVWLLSRGHGQGASEK